MGSATFLFLMLSPRGTIFSLNVLLSNLLYSLSSIVLTSNIFSYSFPSSVSVCQYHVWLNGFDFHLPEYPLSAVTVLPLSPSFSCITFLQPLGISCSVWAVVAVLGSTPGNSWICGVWDSEFDSRTSKSGIWGPEVRRLVSSASRGK